MRGWNHLQSLLERLGQLLSDSQLSGRAAEEVEAILFTFRTLSFEISKRALLLGANGVGLFNAARASSAFETQEELADDAKQSSIVLHRLLAGITQCQLWEVVTTTPSVFCKEKSTLGFVVRELSRMMGSFSSWLQKASSGNLGKELSRALSTEHMLDSIALRFLEFYLSALSVPGAVYHAAHGLRSLAQHCGVKLSSSICIERLLTSWLNLCEADEWFLNLVTEELESYVGYEHNHL